MAVPYPQVVLFGDSLVQRTSILHEGYSMHAELQERCLRRFDVVNRGFSGWNTLDALKYFPELFPKPTESSPQIKYLVVLLGANDAVRPLSGTTQHVAIDEYKRNLVTIITHPHIQAHNPTVLLVTPPPVDEIKLTKVNKEEGWPEVLRKSAISAAYSEKAREVARETPGVILIDLWKAIMDKAIEMAPGDFQSGGPWLGTFDNGKQGGLDHLLPDGLHLGGDAYRVFCETLRPYIGKDYDALTDDDRKEFLFPDWRDLDTAPLP